MVDTPPAAWKPYCLYPHEKAPVTAVRDEWLLGFQQVVSAHADAIGVEARKRARSWFIDLRHRVVEVAISGTFESLEWTDGAGRVHAADETVESTWLHWLEQREDYVAQGRSARGFFKRRCVGGPHPLLMAGLVRAIAVGDAAWRDQVTLQAKDSQRSGAS